MSKGESTKKKLIEEYKSTISKISKDNKILSNQIKDMEINVNINQNILFNYFLESSNENQELNDLINSIKKLWKENLNLLEKKNETQKKLSFLKEISEELPNKIREEIRYYKAKNEKNKEEINKQKEKIIKLQLKLNNIRRNNFCQEAKTEVYITSPNKKNIEPNQEIIIINKMIKRLSPIHAKKEKKTQILKGDLDKLIKQVDQLKKQCYLLNNNNNKQNIDINNIDTKDLNKFIKNNIEGYNFSADENENDEKLDEEDDNNFDEPDEKIDNKKSKHLQKKLEKLKEEYNNMKKQCQEYEELISKHKEKYKNIESKMNLLKNSIEL